MRCRRCYQQVIVATGMSHSPALVGSLYVMKWYDSVVQNETVETL